MERTESETESMALVRLRERAQITLPREVRAALDVKQGDYLEAELVEGGVLLRPAALVARDATRARLREMLSGGSCWQGPGPEPSEDELMRDVVADIKEDRQKRREGDH
jgi:AbrB family looped-hinge helix DNA binding protein